MHVGGGGAGCHGGVHWRGAERCEPQMNAMLAAILSGSTYARTFQCTGVCMYLGLPVRTLQEKLSFNYNY